MDIYGAYLVGYFTAYSGIPFRAFEILGDVARSCSPEELEIIRAHLDFVKSRNSKTADMIVGVEALLAEGGLLQPLKPQTFIQWDIWARTARCAVAVATTRDSSVEVALLVGEATASFASALALEDLLRTVVRGTDTNAAAQMEDSVREVFETRSSIERLAERRGVPTRAASVLNEILSTTVTLNEPISNATHRQTLVRDALEFVNLRVRDIDAAFKRQGRVEADPEHADPH